MTFNWREYLDRVVELLIEAHCRIFHEHEEEEISSVPLKQLQRQWLYDFHISQPEAYAAALGLPPYSEEGAEHARDESDVRLGRIESLMPLLIEQGEWMAKVMVHAGMVEDDINTEEAQLALDRYRHLFVHTCMSVAATLADMGVLHVER